MNVLLITLLFTYCGWEHPFQRFDVELSVNGSKFIHAATSEKTITLSCREEPAWFSEASQAYVPRWLNPKGKYKTLVGECCMLAVFSGDLAQAIMDAESFAGPILMRIRGSDPPEDNREDLDRTGIKEYRWHYKDESLLQQFDTVEGK